MPYSSTNGTIKTQSTDILDLSLPRTGGGGGGAGPGKNRLSFLKRAPNSSISQEPPALGPVNGNATRGRGGSGGVAASESSVSVRSRSKENANRRSFFGSPPHVQHPQQNGTRGSNDPADEEAGWVTSSDLTAGSPGGEDGAVRRSGSFRRANTASSGTSTVGSRVGSVRKRLSMLKLGKKSSKASVLVASVAEED